MIKINGEVSTFNIILLCIGDGNIHLIWGAGLGVCTGEESSGDVIIAICQVKTRYQTPRMTSFLMANQKFTK